MHMARARRGIFPDAKQLSRGGPFESVKKSSTKGRGTVEGGREGRSFFRVLVLHHERGLHRKHQRTKRSFWSAFGLSLLKKAFGIFGRKVHFGRPEASPKGSLLMRSFRKRRVSERDINNPKLGKRYYKPTENCALGKKKFEKGLQARRGEKLFRHESPLRRTAVKGKAGDRKKKVAERERPEEGETFHRNRHRT